MLRFSVVDFTSRWIIVQLSIIAVKLFATFDSIFVKHSSGKYLQKVVGLALDLDDYHPSVLLHCCLGHLTCKMVSEMTYNVSSGTLNRTIPILANDQQLA